MNDIVNDYTAQGFKLTVRQLYYQLVARAVIENHERSYKRITSLVNDARLAGFMDWNAIEDRTRAFMRRTRWDSGKEILQATARGFHMDMWANQRARVFVIIEKEALVGVLENVCAKYDVPLLAARGYPSASVLREFVVEDVLPAITDQHVAIIHLGDHDPSGIDMTRDLRDRIQLFCEEVGAVELDRVALTMEQIRVRKPPPNPAKTTDSRFADYKRLYGSESWELDALPPSFLAELVESRIALYIDADDWTTRAEEVDAIRKRLTKIASGFQF